MNQQELNISKLSIKTLTEADLSEIVKIHTEAFPNSVLSKLGSRIVERYYIWQMTGPHQKVRAVGVFTGEQCAGFCFSGVFNASVSGFIYRNKYFLAKNILLRPWLVFDPAYRSPIKFGLKVLRKFPAKNKSLTEKPKKTSYGILSIAVSVNHQRKGIGKLLMDDAEREAVECGYEQLHLTVNPDNRKAIGLYEKLNWSKSETNPEWKGLMCKKL